MPLRLWISLIVLSLSSFVIVTTELAPIGLLSSLAYSLHQTEGTTGLIVTGYGWIAAISAIISVIALARFPRKIVLIVMMLILSISSLMVAFSQSFVMIFFARTIGAISHGCFWALVGSVSYSLVPKEKLGLATAVIFSGVSIASVLGVPLASYLNQLSSWRLAFQVIAALSFIACILILIFVPKIPNQTPPGKGFYADIFQHPTLIKIFGLAGLVISVHFASFTFIEPFLLNISHLHPREITLLLLIFGLAGFLGNLFAGKFIDHYLRQTLFMCLVLMTSSIFSMGYLGDQSNFWITMCLVSLWGMSIALLFVGLQTWVLKQASTLATPASAVYVAVFNASIGFGALLGSLLNQHLALNSVFKIMALLLIFSIFILIKLKPKS